VVEPRIKCHGSGCNETQMVKVGLQAAAVCRRLDFCEQEEGMLEEEEDDDVDENEEVEPEEEEQKEVKADTRLPSNGVEAVLPLSAKLLDPHRGCLVGGCFGLLVAAVMAPGSAWCRRRPSLVETGAAPVGGKGVDSAMPGMYSRTEAAMLSIPFQLGEACTEYSQDFVAALRRDPFLSQFHTYLPYTWCMTSCDPGFADLSHHCRGTNETCKQTVQENREGGQPGGKPCKGSCWRVAVRHHQESCKGTNGFMIQIEEGSGLSDGQRIEAILADRLRLKVFRTATVDSRFSHHQMAHVSAAVQSWYNNDCRGSGLTSVPLPSYQC